MPEQDTTTSRAPGSPLDGDMSRLERLSTSSPYSPEPPARSRRVEIAMGVATALRARAPYPDYQSKGRDLPAGEYSYDNKNFWEAFNGFVSPESLRSKQVLDVGCGWGGKTVWYAENCAVERIAGFDLPGVFIPETAVAFARERHVDHLCDFQAAHAEQIPYGQSEFDIAIMDDVLEHVADPKAVLRECARVLRPGGLLICRFPSIRMIRAHHFDRALTLPGVHYFGSMKLWAGGFNHYLLHNRKGITYEPFSQVKRSAYGRLVTHDLSGLDLSAFRQVVSLSEFDSAYLELAGTPPTRAERTPGWLVKAYESLRRIPVLREPLSVSIAFVGINRSVR